MESNNAITATSQTFSHEQIEDITRIAVRLIGIKATPETIRAAVDAYVHTCNVVRLPEAHDLINQK